MFPTQNFLQFLVHCTQFCKRLNVKKTCVIQQISSQFFLIVFSLQRSYCYEDARGIFPEVEFVYDLELPRDFKPKVSDGEVSEFYCWPIEEVCTNLFRI